MYPPPYPHHSKFDLYQMVFIPATEFHSQLEALMALLVGIPPPVFTEVRLRCWEQAGRAREERRRQHQEEMERSNRDL